jgi:dTMP kinase
MVKKGKIIVIEGTDCSGKETQARLLLERLNKEGLLCDTISFPRYGSASGDIVGDCYLGKSNRGPGGSWFGDADKVDPKVASLYYAADRRFHRPRILEIINSGKNIIIDRYYTSNMGHQGGKLVSKEERQEIFNWLEKLELELTKLPKEDIVIFLYMPFEVSQELKSRRDKNNFNNVDKKDSHETNPEHLKRAEQAYLELAERYNWVRINCAPDKTMESLKTIEQIHEEVYERVIDKVKEKTAVEDVEKKVMMFIDLLSKKENFIPSQEQSYIHLTEELGEVARQLSNKKMRPELFDEENLKKEIADVILESIILAKTSGIKDLGKELNDKIKELFDRHGFEKE